MKNPFKKESNSQVLIAAGIAGALAAGAGILYYLRAKRAAEAEAYRHEHAQDYLDKKQPKKKKHKTDVSELSEIIHPQA
jgi:uncharacterized protein HemX